MLTSTWWLRAFFALILTAWVVVVAANVGDSSQEPPESPNPQGRPSENPAEERVRNQRNTQQLREPTRTNQQQVRSTEAQGSTDDQPKNQWLEPIVVVTTIYTTAALILLVVLVCQTRLLKRSIDETKRIADANRDSADAAKKSAEAAWLIANTTLSLESPAVFVRDVVWRKGGYSFGDLQVGANAKCSIVNYGRTPALLISHCIECVIANQLPDTPKYEQTVSLKHVHSLEGREPYPMEHLCVALSSEDQVRSVKKGDLPLWIYGYVEFGDILHNTWRTGFCYRWVKHDAKGNSGFVPVWLPAYTYYIKQ